MARIITVGEWADEAGGSAADIEAMVAEAEADAIPPGSLDPSTLTRRNWSPAADARARDLLENGEHWHPGDGA